MLIQNIKSKKCLTNTSIAIILPVFNTAPYLETCLNSIFSQTYKNFHIYAIDDGSTDESLNILLKYKEKDNRLKVYHQKNSGLGAARNLALSLIDFKKYNFISFIDSDDIIHKKFLETLLTNAIENECDICICGVKTLIGTIALEPTHLHYKRPKIFTNEEFIKLIFNLFEWREVNGAGGMVWKALYRTSEFAPRLIGGFF